VAAGVASALGVRARGGGAELADPQRIRRDNEAAGTRDWMTTHVRVDPKTRFRSPGIEGFVSKTSARPGETITLHVSTNPPSPFTIDIYRMGYYQGHGGRFMTRLGPFQGQVQPDPSIGAMRVRECAWEPCATLAIPHDWTSGKTEPEQLELRPESGLFTESGPDEGTLIGARNIYPVIGGGDWICRKPEHWLFEGTGMKEGDAIPGLVGWEWHGAPAAIAGLEVVASGPARTPKTEGTYTATIYPGPRGNFVFNAATIWWADGLSEPPGYVRPKAYTTPHGPDPRVQGITRNLFERFRQI